MIIYAYTTETYQQKGWLKVGQTILTADERIEQQDGTSNPEALIKLREWNVPLTDKQIHAELQAMGCLPVRIDKNREWFKCKVKDVDKAINSLMYGVRRKNSFALREEQRECVEKAAKHFLSGGNKFLVNAKMRFGKTFAAYHIAKEIDAKNVLVLTYKPAVREEWKDSLEQHVDFYGWAYNHGNGFSFDTTAKHNVIFASFQDINDFDKDKWQGIEDHFFDLVVIDEMHYGSDTMRAKTTLSKIRCNKTLFMSGTPLDAIVSGKFDDDEIYTWSYAEEQKKRRDEELSGWKSEVYRWLPKMEIHTFSVSDEVKKNTLVYSDDEQFTMTKMFGSENGETFTDEATVKLFIDQVFGRTVRKEKSPYRTFAPDHSLWVMPPNVKSVNAMCNLLENIVGNEYHIINVAGNNINSLSKVKRQIQHYEKTITVTCGRFNTGVTVPEWDVIMMLNDGKAPETYFQTIFRCQSPDKKRKKEKCFVFDFNPERVLELVYTYAELTAKKSQTTQSGIRQFLEFCPIIDHSDNEMKKVSTEEIVSFVSECGNYIDKFTSSYLFNKELAIDFMWLLNIDKDGIVSAKKDKEINNNNLDIGKNYLYNKVPGQNNRSQKELEELIVEKAKAITQMIPEFVTIHHPSSNTAEMFAADDEIFESQFEVGKKELQTMIKSGFLSEERLNRLITSVTA